jgi:hypothetical protein
MLTLTHGAEPFWTSQHFMETEASLPCLQEPLTGPNPEPEQSSPYYPILSL